MLHYGLITIWSRSIMTPQQRIEIKDILNSFNDRWPEMFRVLYNQLPHKQFTIEIMQRWIKWTKLPKGEPGRIYNLILAARSERKCERQPKVKWKVDIEQVGDRL